MRLFPAVMRSAAIRFGQTTLAVSFGVTAMAAAPLGMVVQPEPVEPVSAPVPAPVQAVASPPGPLVRQMQFVAPLKGYKVNSAFGLRKLSIEAKARAHKGVDIAAPSGTQVYSTAPGKVLRAGHQPGGYGKFIEIKHPNGMTSFYAHLSAVLVQPGERVQPDQVIGKVGSTGYSTGPHLHFEVRRNGVQVNPSKIVGTSVAVKVDPHLLQQANAN